MRRICSCLSSLLLTAALALPILSTGCAARVRVYDPYRSDYHRWNSREDHAYRFYLNERHETYRDYSKRNKDEQREYWQWRHDHRDVR